jgi:hypothetical protein
VAQVLLPAWENDVIDKNKSAEQAKRFFMDGGFFIWTWNLFPRYLLLTACAT